MKTENRQAFETQKCPRCGKPLHFRYVLCELNGTNAISREHFELYCLAGHLFSYTTKDFFPEAK
jgi:hypothetical protein